MNMNLNLLSRGDNCPDQVNVVVEITKGTNVKYEVDYESGMLLVDRVLSESVQYPVNYGFVPKTLCGDGDAIDVLILVPSKLDPGSVVACRPIGVMWMEDESGQDAKILAVPLDKISRTYKHVQDVDDPSIQSQLSEIMHFFQHYKDLEVGKWVKIKPAWGSAKDAKKAIQDSIVMYEEKKKKKKKEEEEKKKDEEEDKAQTIKLLSVE